MIVGPIQFESPAWLVLIPILCIALWWISRRSLSGLGRSLGVASLLVRILVLTALIVAIAEPAWRRESEDIAILLVLDRSASMPDDIADRTKDWMLEAITDDQPGDRIGIVTAAQYAYAQRLPSPEPPLVTIRQSLRMSDLDPGSREGTDLADAIGMALAMKPQSTGGRILVVSDGNETAGNVISASERARAAGVPIDVLLLEREFGTEVILDQLATPANARRGQTVNAFILLQSTGVSSGQLTIEVDGRPYDLTPGEEGSSARIFLDVGENPITVPITLSRSGATRIRAVFTPDSERADTILQNNEASSITFVQGQGRILFYANDSTGAAPLVDALLRADLEVELRQPIYGHASYEELQSYDAVVLFDVPAGDFSRVQQEEISSFVHDGGGGLVMVGGPNSFGAGMWLGTPIADVLPVRLDIPEKRELPSGALAILIDKSGSMSSSISGIALSQMQLAQEGAAASIRALSRLDSIMVIAFDSQWEEIVPMTTATNKDAIIDKLRRIGPGGGTMMMPALAHAVSTLQRTKAGIKHIIVLSDGMIADEGDLTERIMLAAAENQISISAVSIGDASNDRMMQRISMQTGGSWYPINTAQGIAEIPQILVKEAQNIRRSLIWEGEAFSPVQTGVPAPAMRSIGTIPPISGYIVTTDREGLSQVTVRTPEPESDPIIAQWQHGLGRSVAITTDASARWSQQWMQWGGFDRLWEQHVRWAMRPTGAANIRIDSARHGPTTRIIVTALDPEGLPLNFARFAGRVLSPSRSASDLVLTQMGPGRYEGIFPSVESGSYMVAVQYNRSIEDGKTEMGMAQAAVTIPFADEHRALTSNAALMRQVAEMTGGRVLNDPESRGGLFARDAVSMPISLRPLWIFAALLAMGAFLADVAIRRVRIDLMGILRAVRRAVFSRTHAAKTQVDALRMARERVRESLSARSEPLRSEDKPIRDLRSEQHEQKRRASIKFEAATDARADASIIDTLPTLSRANTQPQGTDKAAEEGGIPRLLAAKKRAQDTMKDHDAL